MIGWILLLGWAWSAGGFAPWARDTICVGSSFPFDYLRSCVLKTFEAKRVGVLGYPSRTNYVDQIQPPPRRSIELPRLFLNAKATFNPSIPPVLVKSLLYRLLFWFKLVRDKKSTLRSPL